jgi:kynureninase
MGRWRRWGRRALAAHVVAVAVAVASALVVVVEASSVGVAFANASVTMLDASTGAMSAVTSAAHDAYAYYGFDLASVASDVDVVLDVMDGDAGTRRLEAKTRRPRDGRCVTSSYVMTDGVS